MVANTEGKILAETGEGTAGQPPAEKRLGEPDVFKALRLWHFGYAWLATVFVLACVVAVGLYAYSRQLLHGEIVTGMRTIGGGGATWGLYIVFVIFFIGISFAGISLAGLIRLFGIATMRPIARMAELLTLVALVMGALCVLADLGQPLAGLLNLPRYARPMSPFFGTFTLVMGGYLFASFVYFFLDGRADAAWCAQRSLHFRWLYRLWACGYGDSAAEVARHHRTSLWLALSILPLLVVAHSTLGFIFGIQGGRPGWFNALQGPGFVVMAGVSGTGVLIILAALTRQLLRLHHAIRPEAFRWLGNLLLILSLTYLYFMIAEELTANYAAAESERKIAHEIVFGAYSTLFWTVVGCLTTAAGILFVHFLRGGASIGWVALAGVLVNVAAVLKRYLIVIPSQTHGMLLPYPSGTYIPSWVEVSVVVGLLALGTLLYISFAKVFPIVPVASHGPVEQPETIPAEPTRRRFLRTIAFGITLLGGIVLAVIGFALSSRFGTKPTLDPVIPYSPVLFIVGVVMIFMSAVVYEIIPSAKFHSKTIS
ncbi:MAG: polysulfide reductase NrfD [Planctomycetes bacterium]|nr:polysulfide reductase NrfD [Planctomycetota bacterium]